MDGRVGHLISVAAKIRTPSFRPSPVPAPGSIAFDISHSELVDGDLVEAVTALKADPAVKGILKERMS